MKIKFLVGRAGDWTPEPLLDPHGSKFFPYKVDPGLDGALSAGKQARKQIQSTLVISKSKGLSEIRRDTRTSTYPICRIQEKINRTTTFHKWICNLTPEVRDI